MSVAPHSGGLTHAGTGRSWLEALRSAPTHAWRSRVARRLSAADVEIDGERPWDPQIHDDRAFWRIAAHGSLGLGESYVDGWWDCDRLDELAHRVLRAGADAHLVSSLGDGLRLARSWVWNLQSIARARQVGRHHYDLGNDLFQAMLGERAIYSCGYWRDARTLEEAQDAKLDLIARKLGLEPGMRVLDVGCGWGGAARFFAERYGVEVVGVTISREQARFASDLCRGLPVVIHLKDYRRFAGRFDRAYSIGMFEHVGSQNHRAFLSAVHDHLHRDGLFLLHTIGSLSSSRCGDAWVERYIFPNSVLPSAAQITAASEGRFVIEDWHNFGADYDQTLLAWYRNFERSWPQLSSTYDERFRRMWRYYLLTAAGGFRARRNQLWQIVLSPRGVAGGHESVR
jgi:cyclopropane-fatty-acyl-phospholipid synthase